MQRKGSSAEMHPGPEAGLRAHPWVVMAEDAEEVEQQEQQGRSDEQCWCDEDPEWRQKSEETRAEACLIGLPGYLPSDTFLYRLLSSIEHHHHHHSIFTDHMVC